MSKWRPSPNECIFVIPDIHGQSEELKLILNRILPLRNDKNAKDKLIFLGDYIDRGPDTPKVIDILMKLKKDYGDQVVLLKGNHEHMMFVSMGKLDLWKPSVSPYTVWYKNGGRETILQYADRAGVTVDRMKYIYQTEAALFVDKKHVDFLWENTVLTYELGDYIFVHAGYEPDSLLEDQDNEVLLWDRSLYHFAKQTVYDGKELPWDKTIVCGHSGTGPFINSKYMMLDSSLYSKLFCIELNSLTAVAATYGKKRLIKVKLKENNKNGLLNG